MASGKFLTLWERVLPAKRALRCIRYSAAPFSHGCPIHAASNPAPTATIKNTPNTAR